MKIYFHYFPSLRSDSGTEDGSSPTKYFPKDLDANSKSVSFTLPPGTYITLQDRVGTVQFINKKCISNYKCMSKVFQNYFFFSIILFVSRMSEFSKANDAIFIETGKSARRYCGKREGVIF